MRAQLFHIDTALLTSRCVVRRFRENDGAALYQLVSHQRNALADHFPVLIAQISHDEQAAEGFVRERIAHWLLQRDFAFGIYHNDTTELIGFFFFFDLDWSVPRAEVSFFLDRKHEKQGLMTEVLARMLRFGFRQLELEKICLHTLADNYGSQRVARKTGFSREGDLRNEFRKPGGALADLIRFGISRETYGE